MNGDDARPDYEPYNAWKHTRFYVCRCCGSLVSNFRIHDAWHHRLAQQPA